MDFELIAFGRLQHLPKLGARCFWEQCDSCVTRAHPEPDSNKMNTVFWNLRFTLVWLYLISLHVPASLQFVPVRAKLVASQLGPLTRGEFPAVKQMRIDATSRNGAPCDEVILQEMWLKVSTACKNWISFGVHERVCRCGKPVHHRRVYVEVHHSEESWWKHRLVSALLLV